MDNFRRDMNGLGGRNSLDPAAVAQSVHRDFGELLAIFDRQLKVAKPHCEHRPAVSEARAAAERGFRLSKELIELLSQSDKHV